MKTTKPHVHAEVIRAWADNPAIEIERREAGEVNWHTITKPLWDAACEYRIKPEKVYPETRMSTADFAEALGCTLISEPGKCKLIANAAIRHAIDSGQLVVLDAEKGGEKGSVLFYQTPHGALSGCEMAVGWVEMTIGR